MGGLSRKEWEDLDSIERKRILQRQSIWQGQNKEEWAANIKGNANNIVPTSNARKKNFQRDIERYASYEGGAEEIIIIKSGSEGDDIVETETQGSAEPILVGTGGGGGDDDEMGDLLYKGG